MQALILAGGKGTRLRPLTLYTPKPVVPLMNRPFLSYQIAILADGGITDVTLSLNYQPNKIEEVIGDGREQGVSIRYVTEPAPMGTAGAFRYAADPEAGTTVVLNGDILTDIDISTVLELQRSNNAQATIVLARVADPSRYGLVETDRDGNVLRFLEKPSADEIRDLDLDT
ncbi:MAG TPA: nucleotidyltransferase family protein, partial [Pyrinomonadaceae bacterium]|nr:nucleotidyltransferase family protein [Pyrinomonadaceae bacterium]